MNIFGRSVAPTLIATTVLSISGSWAADLALSSGTLIVAIPTSDGLVVAADSRRTVQGMSCDYGTKLYVPPNMPLTVVGFTGESAILALRIPIRDCHEVELSPNVFNIEPVVLNYLSQHPSSVRQMDAVALAQECMTATTQFLVKAGRSIDRGALAARASFFTVVLAAYEPDTRTSIVREIAVRLRKPDQISVDQTVLASYDQAGKPDWQAFGQGQYVVDHVLNGPGRQFLSDSYKRFEAIAQISQLDHELAIEVAETLIDATSKTSTIINIPAGVGGHVDAYVLSKDGTKKVN